MPMVALIWRQTVHSNATLPASIPASIRLPICPTGAPQYNSTLFCEATMRQCYILNATAASFVDARAACQALGGDSDLIQYTNGA